MYGFKQFVGQDSVVGLYLDGLGIAELSARTGRSPAEIYRTLHANGISPNRLKANHHKVQNMAGLGWGNDEISRLTGYTQRNIRYILGKNK